MSQTADAIDLGKVVTGQFPVPRLDVLRELFDRLHDEVLPKFFVREGNYIIQQLAEVTRSRHAKYGNTVFHLEPNIKEAPGGLRDYNVACWMARLFVLGEPGPP